MKWMWMNRANSAMRSAAFIALLSFTFIGAGYGQTGRVVGISDGDTITVLTTEKEQLKVRLAGIDAPEKGQPFGNAAKKNLSALIYGKDVTLSGKKTDRYGRLVRKVLLDGEDVNLRQITDGFAWYFRKYANELTAADRELYDAAERTAQGDEIGLWAEKERTAPWDHRAAKRTSPPAKRTIRAEGPTRPGEALPSKELHRGPRGGCYYLSDKGRKVYVERSLCD